MGNAGPTKQNPHPSLQRPAPRRADLLRGGHCTRGTPIAAAMRHFRSSSGQMISLRRPIALRSNLLTFLGSRQAPTCDGTVDLPGLRPASPDSPARRRVLHLRGSGPEPAASSADMDLGTARGQSSGRGIPRALPAAATRFPAAAGSAIFPTVLSLAPSQTHATHAAGVDLLNARRRENRSSGRNRHTKFCGTNSRSLRFSCSSPPDEILN